MKITLLIAAGLSLAGYSMAAPTEGSELVKSADLPAVDLTFQGPAFPDGPNVTLTGTAKDVYEQLLAINPEYDAWQMPGYAEKMAQLGVTKDDLEALKARQTVVRLTCYGGRSINWNEQCAEGYHYLISLGGGCYAAPNTCARVSCSRNCPVYFCDRTNAGRWESCASIGYAMSDIVSSCGGQTGRYDYPTHVFEVTNTQCF